MRVIAGSLGGRNFASPRGHRTHPMSEKVRGAVFGSLGDINGLTVLDAFAGSGALAIEAVSRGAGRAIAIDSDNNAHQTIRDNLKTLGLTDKIKAIQAGVGAWSKHNPDSQFDLIFADPPYDDIPYRDLAALLTHLKPGGLLVLSWPGQEPAPVLEPLDALQTKSYGDAQLVFYRKNG